MHGLAFKLNTVTFSTFYSESEREQAGHFGHLIREIVSAKLSYFGLAVETNLRSFRKPEMYTELSKKYPQFARPRSKPPIDWTWIYPPKHGGARWQCYQYTDYAIRLFSRHPDFIHALARENDSAEDPRCPEFVCSPYLHSHPDPWEILSKDEVADLAEYLEEPEREWPESEHYEYCKRIKWRWSAAALSIYFMKSISLSTRLQLQNIVLLEDHPSVPYSEW